MDGTEVRHRSAAPDDDSGEPPRNGEIPNGPPPGAPALPQSAASSHRHLLQHAMTRRHFLVLFLTILLYLAARSGSSGDTRAPASLVKAFVAFRHGTRAPGFTYNNDPYNRDDEKIWPDGAGELTKAGKQEAYELGGNLKARYKAFIGDYYKPKDFKAYSSQIERTIMSAQLVLASFFLPKGYQEWNSGLSWQPIPVYNDDLINSTAGLSCPRSAAEIKIIFKSLVPADVGLTNEELRIFVENTGEDKESPYSLAVRVWDSVYFQDRAKLPIPKWVQPLFPEKMNALGLKFIQKYLTGTETQKLLVLDPHGRGLVNFFNDSQRKLEFHSGHDINILSLFTLLGIKIDSFPQPGCAIAVELHRKDGKDYFEVYYFPDSKSKRPVQMKMACGVSCPLSELIGMAKVYYVDNYHELCHSSNEKPQNPLGFKTGSH